MAVSNTDLDVYPRIGKHAEGKPQAATWADLVQLEPSYVNWAVENMRALHPERRAALTRALLAKHADADPLEEERKFQDQLPWEDS